ncbi:hypothetical protein WJX81_000001 [Elliptochloris bilobata]|uniref:Ion transport domain-containing protein n=1 Tax=Elliptochloris bilobata TaxID=381761 RepID=A0AAW1S082_9CHLO
MDSDPLLEGQRAEADLERLEEGGVSETYCFEDVVNAHPKRAFKWLELHGAEKLGEFDVPEQPFYAALGDGGLLTLGLEERCPSDVELEWQTYLAQKRYSRGRKVHKTWGETVAVEAFVIPIRNAAAADNVGLLQPTLRRYLAGRCSMLAFGLPPLQAVVDYKWTQFALKLLYVQLAMFAVWLLSFTVFTKLFQDEDESLSLRELLDTKSGRWTVALEVVATVFMLPFMYIEYHTFSDFGWGWLNTENIIDALTYSNQAAIVIMHLSRQGVNSDSIVILMAAQCILLWLRLQYYLRVFRASKFAFVDTLVAIMADVKIFLVFLFLTLLGFAASFHVLYKKDQDEYEVKVLAYVMCLKQTMHQEYRTLWQSIFTVFNVAAAGEYDTEVYLKTHFPLATATLLCLFLFVVTVMLFNVLIALLTNASQKMTDNAGLRAVISKAQVIDELENTLPGWVKRQHCMFPAFIHVLKEKPGGDYEISSDSLWALRGETLVDASQETRLRTFALEDRLEAIETALTRLHDALLPGDKGRGAAGKAATENKIQEGGPQDDPKAQGTRATSSWFGR